MSANCSDQKLYDCDLDLLSGSNALYYPAKSFLVILLCRIDHHTLYVRLLLDVMMHVYADDSTADDRSFDANSNNGTSLSFSEWIDSMALFFRCRQCHLSRMVILVEARH